MSHIFLCRENFPSHFKFKEYCPLVFRQLRERFGIDDSHYAVSSWLLSPILAFYGKYIQVCTYKLQICETMLFNLYFPGFLSESSLSHALTWSKWCQILYFQRQKVLCENNREWRYWKTSQHSSTVPSCEYGSFQRSVIIITNNFPQKLILDPH